jgi:hypothetical protein
MKPNTPQEEIEITQQDHKRLKLRLANFLNFHWEMRNQATPAQVAAHNAVNLAIDEVITKLKVLKEAMR